MPTVRAIYVWLLRLTLALVVLQFVLAGLGIFGETSFDAHEGVGILLHIPIAALLVILAAVAIRGAALGMAVVLSLLLFLQPFWVPQGDARWIGALHVAMPLAILGLGFHLSKRLSAPPAETPA